MGKVAKEKAERREKKRREEEFADFVKQPKGLVPKSENLSKTQQIVAHLTSINPPSNSEIAKLVGVSRPRVTQVKKMLAKKSREAALLDAQLRAELAKMHLESQQKIKDRLDLTNRVLSALKNEMDRLEQKKVKGLPINLVKKLAMIMKEDREYIRLLLESMGHQVPDDTQSNKTIAKLIDIFYSIIEELPTDLKEKALEKLNSVEIIDADYEVIDPTDAEIPEEAASSADAGVGNSESYSDASRSDEDASQTPDAKCCHCPKLETDWPDCTEDCKGPIAKKEDLI